MGSFVLVHGAWHGAWCWERVTPLLEAAGHRVCDAFYGECSAEVAAWASAQNVPESLEATAAPVHLTDARAGSVRRVYVECTRDRAITVGKQREMLAARPCEQVLTIDTDHPPFLSTPEELAGHLLAIV